MLKDDLENFDTNTQIFINLYINITITATQTNTQQHIYKHVHLKAKPVIWKKKKHGKNDNYNSIPQ